MKLSALLENFDSFKELKKKLLEYQSDLIEEFDCQVFFKLEPDLDDTYEFVLSKIEHSRVGNTLSYPYRTDIDEFDVSDDTGNPEGFVTVEELKNYIWIWIGHFHIEKILNIRLSLDDQIKISLKQLAKLIEGMEKLGYEFVDEGNEGFTLISNKLKIFFDNTETIRTISYYSLDITVL